MNLKKLPSALFNIKGLEIIELDISFNQLTELPSTIKYAKSIK